MIIFNDYHCRFWYNQIMESLNFMQSNYTDNYNAIQLSLPLDLGIKINPDDEAMSLKS